MVTARIVFRTGLTNLRALSYSGYILLSAYCFNRTSYFRKIPILSLVLVSIIILSSRGRCS